MSQQDAPSELFGSSVTQPPPTSPPSTTTAPTEPSASPSVQNTPPIDRLDNAIQAYASAHKRYDPASVDPELNYLAAHGESQKPSRVQTDPVKEKAWETAMLAYSHARFTLNLSRREASKIFEPMMDDPYHHTSAKLMLDLANRYPD